jgi:hypothetical protein
MPGSWLALVLLLLLLVLVLPLLLSVCLRAANRLPPCPAEAWLRQALLLLPPRLPHERALRAPCCLLLSCPDPSQTVLLLGLLRQPAPARKLLLGRAAGCWPAHALLLLLVLESAAAASSCCQPWAVAPCLLCCWVCWLADTPACCCSHQPPVATGLLGGALRLRCGRWALLLLTRLARLLRHCRRLQLALRTAATCCCLLPLLLLLLLLPGPVLARAAMAPVARLLLVVLLVVLLMVLLLLPLLVLLLLVLPVVLLGPAV